MSRHHPGNHKLTPELMLRAYATGIFPMAESRDDANIFWVDPQVRGIMPLATFHVPRRLKKTIRSGFDIRLDTAFADVLRLCGEEGNVRPETWINGTIENAVLGLFEMGFAHSIETWKDGKLVGGLYGIALGGAFFGESMFSRETDASKVALVHLVARLRKGGFRLLDTQFVTRHLSQFGAVEIHRSGYRQLLSSALDVQATFYSELDGAEFEEFLQSTTQTS